MAGCATSKSSVGLFYQVKSNDKVLLKKQPGSDDVFQICFQRNETRSKGEFLYEIAIEIKGEKLAQEIFEIVKNKYENVDYLGL